MKKILLILITLTSFIPIITKRNDYIDVTKVIYINSICLDINEDNNQYDCYFYVLNNFNLAQAEISSNNVDNLAYVAKITAPTLTEAFRKLNQISNIYIHYNHLRTVILTNKFLNNQYLFDFYQFIKDDLNLYPSFYLFATDSKPEDIFNIENFSEISAYHTLLINPDLIKSYKLITFMDFAKAITINNYTLLMPHISCVKKIFSRQDEEYYSLFLDGYTFYNKDNTLLTIFANEFKPLHWLSLLNNTTYNLGEYNLYIKKGKYKLKKYKQTIIITFTIKGTLTKKNDSLSDKENFAKINDLVLREINELVNFMYNQPVDVFNINYYFGCNYNYFKNCNVEVKLKLNLN